MDLLLMKHKVEFNYNICIHVVVIYWASSKYWHIIWIIIKLRYKLCIKRQLFCRLTCHIGCSSITHKGESLNFPRVTYYAGVWLHIQKHCFEFKINCQIHQNWNASNTIWSKIFILYHIHVISIPNSYHKMHTQVFCLTKKPKTKKRKKYYMHLPVLFMVTHNIKYKNTNWRTCLWSTLFVE